MYRTAFFGTGIVLATATTAFAGGIAEPVIAPAPAPVVAAPAPVYTGNDWTGFYFGGQYGLGNVSIGGAETDMNNYGLHAGYLYDLGTFVVGAEIDGDWLEVEGAEDDENSVLRIKGIAGYDAGAFLPYATAGFAQLTLDDGTGATTSDTGYFFGAGATYAVTDNIRVGLEYLDHRFDDFDGGGTDIEAQTTSLKVSYSF